MAEARRVEDPDLLERLRSGEGRQRPTPLSQPSAPAPEPESSRLRVDIRPNSRRQQFTERAIEERRASEGTLAGRIKNRGMALARGAADTLSFGGRDESMAYIDSLLGGNYDKALDSYRAEDDADESELFGYRVAGQIGGGLVPIGGAAGGASTLGRALLRGMTAGGITGTLYGYGSGEDGVDSRLESAGVGGGIGALAGAAGPVLGGVVGTLGRAAMAPINTMRAWRNPGTAAERMIRSAQREGRPLLSESDYRQAERMGLDPRAIDMGTEEVRALGRWATNASPTGRDELMTELTNRREGMGPATARFIEGLVGGPVDTAADEAALREMARRVNKGNYDTAYSLGKNLWTDRLKQLSSSPTVQTAMRDALKKSQDRAALDGTPGIRSPFKFGEDGTMSPVFDSEQMRMLPNLDFWDAVKISLDDMHSVLSRSGERGRAGDVDNLRRALRDELDTLVPSYKRTRGVAETFFRAYDAMDAGRMFARSSYRLPEARSAVQRMTAPERELLARGFADEVTSGILSQPNPQSYINRTFSTPAARAKVEIALGPARAAELETFLRLSDVMRRSQQAIASNSTTARQLMESGLLGAGAAGVAWSADPQSMTTGALLAAALRRGNSRLNERVAREIAERLASPDPSVLSGAIRQVSRTPDLMVALRAITGSTGVVVGGRTGEFIAQDEEEN